MTLNIMTAGTATNATTANENWDEDLRVAHYSRMIGFQALQDAGLSLLGEQTNLIGDLMSDSTGWLNTIDTGNTTSSYKSSEEAYASAITAGSPETKTTTINDGTDLSFTVTCTAATRGYISEIICSKAAAGTTSVTVNIKNSGGTTIATKTNGAVPTTGATFTFTTSDYSELIESGTFSIQIVGSANLTTQSGQSYSGTNFSYTSQKVAGQNAGSAGSIQFTDAVYANSLVQTNALTSTGDDIDSVSIAVNRDWDGTTDITYDASSDGGSTYTTSLALDVRNTLTSTLGNDLIIKFNLPGNASTKLYNYSGSIGRS